MPEDAPVTIPVRPSRSMRSLMAHVYQPEIRGRRAAWLSSLGVMKDRPEGVSQRELAHALAGGWGITPVSMVYAPVGAGSYHWIVDDRRGSRWFVNVDDLDHKSWLGDSRVTRLGGLRTNLKTALGLRDQAGLEFVAAPVPGRNGEAAELFHPRYAVSVYPFIDGVSGQSDDRLCDSSRSQLIDMLAALH